MNFMIFGYVRVSKNEPNPYHQETALKEHGCEILFFEKLGDTGKNRPEFIKLITLLKKGDTIVVLQIGRLGCTTVELIKLMSEFKNTGIHFISVNDSIDTNTPSGKIWYKHCSVFAENERELNIERTSPGLESARARGKNGGRPSGLSERAKKVASIAAAHYLEGKMSVTEIMDSLNIKSKTTLYSYLRKSGVVIKSWANGEGLKDGSAMINLEAKETNLKQTSKQINSDKHVLKPDKNLKKELAKLINSPTPTDKRNKVRFEKVTMSDARRHVQNGGKCWTDIVQDNGNIKQLTYFDSPDNAIKEREKTGSNGYIWIEDPETKEMAYIVNKRDKKPI